LDTAREDRGAQLRRMNRNCPMRYSLRTLLIVLAGFAVLLGIYRHRAEVQKEVVRSITRKEASVVYQGILLDELSHSFFYSEPVR